MADVCRMDMFSGVVYWALETMGCALLSSIWVRIHHRAEDDGGANRSTPEHIVHVLVDAVRAEIWFYYDKDHNGSVAVLEVRR
jgi:hypothetical protein